MNEILVEISRDYNLQYLKEKVEIMKEVELEENNLKVMFLEVMEIIIRSCEKEDLNVEDNKRLEELEK